MRIEGVAGGGLRPREDDRGDLVLGREEGVGVTPRLAGHLGGDRRVDDDPGVHQVDRRVEVVGPFQEERPGLGEEEIELLVDAQPQHVGLDLREVGVDGAVQAHVRRDAPAHRRPQLGVDLAVLELAVGSTRSSNRDAVRVGMTSRLLPAFASSIPTSLTVWLR